MRFTLRLKLLSAFGLMTVVIVALSLYSATRLASSNNHTKALGTRVVPATGLIGQAVAMMNKFRKDELHYILSTPAERAGAAGVSGDLAGDLTGMSQILSSYRSGHLTSDANDAADLAAFRHDFNRYVALTAPFRHLADRGRLAQAGQVVGAGAGDNEYNLLKLAATAWVNHDTEIAAQVARASQSSYSTSVTLLIVLTLLGVLIAVAVALLLARNLTAAARQVGSAAEAIAEGDVDQRVEVSGSDELGQMAQQFSTMIEYLRGVVATAERIADGDLTAEVHPRSERDALGHALARMVENLRALVGHITDASTSLTESSKQMAATSEETGRAAGEIAVAVSEVATGAERQVRSVEGARELTRDVVEAAASSAEGVRSSADAAREARAVAARGDEAVSHATDAMHAVRESSSAVTDAIRQLGAKSAEIGGIVATITAIAEQTNLLALNAAIEAARAGEQGRGFAVVAEEVRKLAEEAQQAAGSIAGLVNEIQSETARTVEVVELGSRRTAEGTETVERAREAFHELGASVEDMTGRVEGIAAAIDQIAASARSVSENMDTVAEVAEHSSATTSRRPPRRRRRRLRPSRCQLPRSRSPAQPRGCARCSTASG